MGVFSALGTPNMPLQAPLSVASAGGETAHSHIHIINYPNDLIDSLCGEMRALFDHQVLCDRMFSWIMNYKVDIGSRSNVAMAKLV